VTKRLHMMFSQLAKTMDLVTPVPFYPSDRDLTDNFVQLAPFERNPLRQNFNITFLFRKVSVC